MGEYLYSELLERTQKEYIYAYLENNDIAFDQEGNPVVDGQTNYGSYHNEAYCIRAENDQNRAYYIRQSGNLPIRGNDLIGSDYLLNEYLRAITNYILLGIKDIPSQLTLGIFVNHHDTHWTTFLAHFNGLNQNEYEALYNAAHMHLQHNPVRHLNEGSTELDKRTHEFEQVVRFVIHYCGQTEQNSLGDRLPVSATNINLEHYDSLGAGTEPYEPNLQAQMIEFTTRFNANYQAVDCALQLNSTCADHSSFNAMNVGLGLNLQCPGSYTLRHFSNNITRQNAHQILSGPKAPAPAPAQVINNNATTGSASRIIMYLASALAGALITFMPFVNNILSSFIPAIFGVLPIVGATLGLFSMALVNVCRDSIKLHCAQAIAQAPDEISAEMALAFKAGLEAEQTYGAQVSACFDFNAILHSWSYYAGMGAKAENDKETIETVLAKLPKLK